MTEHSLIPDDLLRQIIGVGQVDLLVGLAAPIEQDGAAEAIRAVRNCFRTYFPRQRTALLVADHDGAAAGASGVLPLGPDAAAGPAGLRTTHLITTTVPEVPGEDRLSRVVLAAGDLLQARAVVVLDGAGRLRTPQDIAGLAGPALAGRADLMAPVYQRGAADGLLVTQLLRPLVRGVFGWRVEEPLLQEFACSGRLAAHCTQAAWSTNDAQRASRLWITAEALHGGFTVAQQRLGAAPGVARGQQSGLRDLFPQIVGSAFASVDAHSAAWLPRRDSVALTTGGEPPPRSEDTERIVDASRLVEHFAEDVQNLHDVLRLILEPQTLEALVAASARPDPAFTDGLWAETLVEFLVAYHRGVMRRDHVTQALTPIYAARTGVFLLGCHPGDPDTVSQAHDALGAHVEALKPRIVERWGHPA